MKKILTLSFVFISSVVFSQEAGKSGELLKNQATIKEMQQRSVFPVREQSSKQNSRNEGRNTNQNYGKNTPTKYSWNQNYGYAEVFLRIPEYGYFTVEIDDQVISSSTGKYRFFDLNAGKMQITIYDGNYLIYRSQINVRNNTRLVLDFFSDYGLYLLDSYRVQGQNYGVNEWDDVWNNSYRNSRNDGRNSNTYLENNRSDYPGNSNFNPKNDRLMTESSFEQFLFQIKKSSFDKDKLAYIEQQIRHSQFTSAQIKALLQLFDFDNSRLKAGKILYENCVDVTNFYIVYDTFSFDQNRNSLMDYVSRKR